MSAEMIFRAVYIRPQKDFGSLRQATRISGVDEVHNLNPRYFDVPLISVLVDVSGMPVWEPTLYLAYLSMRGRSLTGDTVRSYSEALLTWFSFLAELNIRFRYVTEDDFARFRFHAVSHVSRANAKGWASATANHRISVVSSFYMWAERRGVLRTPLGEFLITREAKHHSYDRLESSRHNFRGHSLAPAVISRLPKVLSLEEIHRLFRATPTPYRIIFKWALLTGLRRFEICNLLIKQLPTPEQLALSNDRFSQIVVLRKGRRESTLYVPRQLIEETQWYVLIERPAPAVEGTDQIFLGARGKIIDRGCLSRAFTKEARSIGSDATFHHLRHTYAVNVLRVLENCISDGDSLNAIKTLQVLMGHASFETTEIYLRAMDVTSDAVMQALDYLYGATL